MSHHIGPLSYFFVISPYIPNRHHNFNMCSNTLYLCIYTHTNNICIYVCNNSKSKRNYQIGNGVGGIGETVPKG